MKKILDFIKSNILVAKWTIWYFFVLWLILQFVFKFNPFSAHYWWKFFHATLHGFPGFVFGLLIYTAIPIYLATAAIIYRKKELIIKIAFIDKVFAFVSKLFPKKENTTQTPEPEDKPENKEPEISGPEYPSDMPPELRIPYMRAKNNMSWGGTVSAYNKQKNDTPAPQTSSEPETETNTPVPIPTDFDLSDSGSFSESVIPTFTDINFDEPKEEKPENNTTRYLTSKNIEYETYKQFIATKKHVIYEHSDDDFWIMDENIWFASGKQIDSPISELKELAQQNELIPVLYLKSQNIMDIETVIEQIESAGVRVVKSLEELD